MSEAYELGSCPACGSTAVETVADRDEIRREVEELWLFHTRRLRPGTAPERLADQAVFSLEPPLHLAGCGRCGTVYRTPRRTAADLETLYAEEEVDAATLAHVLETTRHVARRQARALRLLRGGAGRVVEVGSYAGAFLEEARAEGWEVLGVEPSRSAARWLDARGLPVKRGTLETLAREEGQRGVADAVAIWNCFDQLPDPRATLRAAHALLAPGGLLGLRVPNGALYRRLRARLGRTGTGTVRAVLAWNNLLSFPYRTGFTPKALVGLLRDTGFEPLEVRGDVLVRVSGGWTRGWARLEERLLKGLLRLAPAGSPELAPWLEVYARVAPIP